MASTSEIKINYEAIERNISFLKTIIDSKTQVSAVVKGNAYGHGIHIMVPVLEELGINHFSVYSSTEAKEAFYAKNLDSTIMIMGFIYEEDYSWVIKNNIEFFISDLSELQKAVLIAKSIEKKALIHIDVETGMHRTGLLQKELKKAITLITENIDFIEVKGVTSHLAGAESIANFTRIRKQLRIFKNKIKYLINNNINPQVKHIASSAAAITYPEMRMDLVRIGILIYGYWPTRETFIHYIHRRKNKYDPLEPVLNWYSQLISIKTVEEGEFIGYGLSYLTQQKKTIGIIPVGYSNGYSRSLSNNGHILIKGLKALVIGSVNMNMIICDISNIPNAKVGDTAVLIGKQGDREITFSSFAEMNNAMNYEILARLPENIKRIVYFNKTEN